MSASVLRHSSGTQDKDLIDEAGERGTLIRDASRSTSDWEKRADGKYYKVDYYKLLEEEKKYEVGMEVLERFFVGSYKVVENDEWLRLKHIRYVLVLGSHSHVEVKDPLQLKVLEVQEDNLQRYLDDAVALIKEALTESEGHMEAVLMVDKDMRTFCPVVVIAYLMAVLGWSLQVAIEKVQSIFKTTIAGYQLYVLQRWEQTITSRKSVTVKREVIKQESPPVVVAPPPPPPVVVQQPIVLPAPQPIVIQEPQPIMVQAPQIQYPSYSYYLPTQMQWGNEVQSYPTTTYQPTTSYATNWPSTIDTSLWNSSYFSATPQFSAASFNTTPQYTTPQYTTPQYSAASFNSYTLPAAVPQVSYSAPVASVVNSAFNAYSVSNPLYMSSAPVQTTEMQFGGANYGAVSNGMQQQIVQTTTTSSASHLVRGSASWHSGGVVVRH